MNLATGGFDPVAIAAVEGDLIAIEVLDNADAEGTTVVLKRGEPPRVVRTDPGASRTDVPLTSIIRIVFSAPISPSSAHSSVHLRTGDTNVAGTTRAVAGAPTMIDLVPAAALTSQTVYSLEIGTGARDLAGNALAAAINVPFTTGRAASRVRAVRITPSSLDIVAGAQHLMSAVPVDARGNALAAPCAWATSNAPVAAISSAGALSAIAPGTAVVTATCSGVSGTANVTVVSDALGTHVIAFVSVASDTSRWYLMDGSGAAPSLIREVGATESDPILSSDGQRIAFASRGGAAGAGIFVMKSDGSESIQLTQAAPASTSVPLGWSSDGTRVLYLTSAVNSGRGYTATLSSVSAGGGTAIHLATIPHSWGHVLSPDGSMIAFSSDTTGTAGGQEGGYNFTTELHVMGTDGAHERALVTAGPTIPFPIGPAWSPDGQWVAFSSDGCDMDNLSNLYRIRADGSDLTMLARIDPGTLSDPSWACVGAPNWSPDGARLVVSTHDPSGGPPAGSNTFTLVDASTGQLGPRYPTRFGVPQSAWSPDGTALAILQFNSVDDSEMSLYLSSPAGAPPVLLAAEVSDMVFLR